MNNPQQWVQERRLRPIYELLDGGNNKKVIAEVDRLMKKQPNFTCAKVLKALALIRMNKTAEAQAILSPVATEAPTDDSTIQALSICYRELEDPDKLSKILDSACEKEKSEELLTHCFMAHVRMSNYLKMHRVALQLYKLYQKPTYYGWAVASLVLQYENKKPGPLSQKDTKDIDFAGILMDKLHREHKTLDDNMLVLYIHILAWQGNWRKVVEVLQSAGFPQRDNWTNDDFHMYYFNGLKQTGMSDELFDYLKLRFLNNSDDYGMLKELIDNFAYQDVQMVLTFLNKLLETMPNRTVVLGHMYFTSVFIGGEVGLQQIESKLPLAFKYGVDKPSFCSDVMQYYRAIKREAQFKIMNDIAPCPEPDVSNFDSISKIIKDVNFEHAFKEYISEHDNELTRIRHANVCFGKYLICEGVIETLRTEDNLRTKESDYHDQYILITALSLMLDFYESPKLLEGCDLDTYLHSQEWTQLDIKDCHELRELKKRLSELVDKEKLNCKGNDTTANSVTENLKQLHIEESDQVHLNDKEALLIFAICVLEYGLARSPYNYSIRILLSRAYIRFGAVGQAVKVIQGLDLKHVQWDSLGYLIIPYALTSGAYSDAVKMLNVAETMYTSYKRESMEHVIAAYKYGSFKKVTEFIRFRQCLLGSVQFSQIFDEKRLLELMLFTGNSSDLLNLAKKIIKDIGWKEDQDNRIADNRDFTVLEQFHLKVTALMFKEMATETMRYTNMFRHFCLFIMSCVIVHADEPSHTHIKDQLLICEEYYKSCEKLIEENGSPEDTENMPQLYGIWPPRDHRYFKIPAAHIALELCRFVTDALIEHERSNIGGLQKLIQDSSSVLIKHLNENFEAFCNDKRMIKIDFYLQDFHYALEIFSFMRIALFVVLTITKQQMKMKGKQKGNQLLKRSMAAAVDTLLDKFKELNECFNVFINELQARHTPHMDNMKSSLRDLLKESFLSVAFPSTFDIAQNNIRESHLNQVEEMRKICTSLAECIRNTLANELK